MKLSSKGDLKVTAKQVPSVHFTLEAFMKMQFIVDEATSEVGWLGAVRRLSPVEFIVDEIYIVEQKASMAECDLDKDSIADLIEPWLADPDGIDRANAIRLWGHSHVNMGVGPSPTDVTTFKDFYESCDYFIMLIQNKRGEMRVDVTTVDSNLIYHDCPWSVEFPDMSDIKKQIKAEIKEKVKPPGAVQTQWDNGWEGYGYGNHWHDQRHTPEQYLAYQKFTVLERQRWQRESKVIYDIFGELAMYAKEWPKGTNAPAMTIDNVIKIDNMVEEVLDSTVDAKTKSKQKYLNYRVEVAKNHKLFKKLVQETKAAA